MSKKPKVRINQNLIEFFEEELLNCGEKQDSTLTFTIPLYQREYSWGPDEKKLFSNNLKNNSGCTFMGTIILQRSNSPFTFEVIDGQQRLTTLLNLNSPDKDQIYGIFKFKNNKISLERIFDKWKRVQTQEEVQTSFIETDEIILKAKFNWIIFTKDLYGDKSSSEKLFQRINIDSKLLSVFDEFKAHYIQAEYRGDISEPKEVIPWKKIENLFVTNTYKNIKPERLSITDILNNDNRADLFCEFNELEHEWLLRQFLAVCYQILRSNSKERKFYKDNKSTLNDKDPIRKEIRDIKFFSFCSNEGLSKGLQIGKVISTLIQGIGNNELLISRNQVKDLSKINALQKGNTQNQADKDALFLLLSFQIFSMSFQTWLSSNTYDQCFLIYKNYYERKNTSTGKLSIEDVDFISNETILDLLNNSKQFFKSIQAIKGLDTTKFRNISFKKSLIRDLEKAITTSRSDLWIADWVLFSFLFKRRKNNPSEEIQLQQKLHLENAFEKAFESAFYMIDMSDSKENIQKTTQKILQELDDIYFSKEGSLDTLPTLIFSNEIEHWCPQAPKSKNGQTDQLNFYGNLCLLPKSINIELSNQTPNIKAEYILKTKVDQKKLLPKIYLTALITEALDKNYRKEGRNSGELTAEELIRFLTVFWLIFISESIPNNYHESIKLI